MRHWYFGLVALALATGATLGAQNAPGRAESKDMTLVGHHDLQARSAYQPTIHRHGNRYIAYIGHHGGEQLNSLTGAVEMNGTSILDVTNPRAPTLSRPHSRGKGPGRAGRRADGARLQRQRSPERARRQGLPAALVRQLRPRDLGRHRSGEAGQGRHAAGGPAQYAQELLGVQHRDRLRRLGPEGLARRAA